MNSGVVSGNILRWLSIFNQSLTILEKIYHERPTMKNQGELFV